MRAAAAVILVLATTQVSVAADGSLARAWRNDLRAAAERVTKLVRSGVNAHSSRQLEREATIVQAIVQATDRWPLELRTGRVYSECRLSAQQLATATEAAARGNAAGVSAVWPSFEQTEIQCELLVREVEGRR